MNRLTGAIGGSATGGSVGGTSADVRLLRRAWVTVAATSALATTVLLLAMAASVMLLEGEQLRQQAARTTHSAYERTGQVWDVPEGMWAIHEQDGVRMVTVGSPNALNGLSATELPDGPVIRNWEGYHVLVWTGDKGDGSRVSVVYDMATLDAEKLRLWKSLALGCSLAVIGAALVGAWVGRRAVRPLGSALSVQRRFVADAGHELRTPLTVLATRAQLLRRKLGPDADPAVVRDVERLVADAKVLGDVVTDLLIAAEVGRRPEDAVPVDVAALVREASQSLAALAGERGVALHAEIEAGPATVLGAPVPLRRAVTALVDNALAHTPEGGNVTLSVTADDRTVRLAVADDGEGLDPETAPRLVERFARGTTADAGRRFGLGLALVDEVARGHGGRLKIDGALGVGATFTLELPRTADELEEAPAAEVLEGIVIEPARSR